MLSHSAHSVGVVDLRPRAALRAARRLGGEQRVDPRAGVGMVGGRGMLDLLDPVAGVERARHRLGLERGLAPEQVGDHAARLAVALGDGAGVEPRERADRGRAPVERLGVALDLLQRGELPHLHVAARAPRPWAASSARRVASEPSHREAYLTARTLRTYGTYLRTYRTYVSPELRSRLCPKGPGRERARSRPPLPPLSGAGSPPSARPPSRPTRSTPSPPPRAPRSPPPGSCTAPRTRSCSGFLALSYVAWGAGLRRNLSANWALLEQTGTSTNALSKAAHDLAALRGWRPRTRRLAGATGYVATELAKEAPYYAGAFGAALVSDSVSSGDAIVFLARREPRRRRLRVRPRRADARVPAPRPRLVRHRLGAGRVPRGLLRGRRARRARDDRVLRRRDPRHAPDAPILFFGTGPTLHHVFLSAGPRVGDPPGRLPAAEPRRDRALARSATRAPTTGGRSCATRSSARGSTPRPRRSSPARGAHAGEGHAAAAGRRGRPRARRRALRDGGQRVLRRLRDRGPRDLGGLHAPHRRPRASRAASSSPPRCGARAPTSSAASASRAPTSTSTTCARCSSPSSTARSRSARSPSTRASATRASCSLAATRRPPASAPARA